MIYTEAGESIPVSVISVTPNRITQIKKIDTDGYFALQITAGQKRASRITKSMTGHFRNAGVEAGEIIREFRVTEQEVQGKTLGDEINVSLFKKIKQLM